MTNGQRLYSRYGPLPEKTIKPTPQMTILFFHPHEAFGWLSNFSSHGIFVNDVFWPTVEHFYQAQKFIDFQQYREAIQQTNSPKKAKRVARTNAIHIRSDWTIVKDEVMYQGLTQKFKTHPKLALLLQATEQQELVENAPHDNYWGCGKDGQGLNRLGKMLMQIRDELSS